MEKTGKDPSEYLDSLPDDRREDMKTLDRLISGVMQGHSRVMWEGVFWGGSEQTIIGYGDYVSKRARGQTVEWFMVGLALQKRYISLYVNAVEDGQYATEKYRSQLGKVKIGKSSISFERLADLNQEGLTQLLKVARGQLPPP
jgi:hypothetical protein